MDLLVLAEMNGGTDERLNTLVPVIFDHEFLRVLKAITEKTNSKNFAELNMRNFERAMLIAETAGKKAALEFVKGIDKSRLPENRAAYIDYAAYVLSEKHDMGILKEIARRGCAYAKNELGKIAMDNGNIHEALEYLTRAKGAGCFEAAINICICNLNFGSPEKAVLSLKEALRKVRWIPGVNIHPRIWFARTLLATLLLEGIGCQKDVKTAIKMLNDSAAAGEPNATRIIKFIV